MLEKLTITWAWVTARLHWIGPAVALLGLRLIMAWEYGEAGFEKLHGNNWFAHIHDSFPFPFSILPADVSGFIATWAEIIAAFALTFGLFTRFWAFTLLILTTVAVFAVHWPDSWDSLAKLWQGYAISNDGHGNFKLPLLFMLILLPLVFIGPGRLSLDALLRRKVLGADLQPRGGLAAGGLTLLVIGVPLLFVMPRTALALTLPGIALVALEVFWQRSHTVAPSAVDG